MPKKWIYAAIAAVGLTLALVAPAAAHVVTNPGEATQGDYATFAFLVPNERPDAGTVKLEITLPSDHPIASVRTKPMAGWTAAVIKDGATARGITWTATQGVRINPGEYQEFEVSMGPLPKDTDKLVMPAAQTYDNGEVVAWDEPPADGAEPQRPAPVLALRPESGGAQAHSSSGHAQHGAGEPTTGVSTLTHGATDATARWLSGAALAVGALGLGLGTGAAIRARRRSSS
ncbi:MAG: YcnI family protein [Actinomycetota bacterium]|nr:YcnI family protein [Actinomycetota bacterium]